MLVLPNALRYVAFETIYVKKNKERKEIQNFELKLMPIIYY